MGMIDKEKLEELEIILHGIEENFKYLEKECGVIPLDAYKKCKEEMSDIKKRIIELRKKLLWPRKR